MAALEVFERKRMNVTHPWQLVAPKFKCYYVYSNLLKAVRSLYKADLVLVVGWDSLIYLLLSLLMSPFKRMVLWTDTPDPVPRGIVHALTRGLIIKYVSFRYDELWGTGEPGCVALKLLGVSRSKIISCPFYLDPDYVKNEPERSRALRMANGGEGSLISICVGQLKESKGVAVAIEALVRAPKIVKLWIVGDGPERESLELLVRQFGLGDRVIFMGWLQPEEVALAINAADVLVHPALADPFPTVVLDAMVRGKPVIGTMESGSVRDRIIDGWNGYKIAANDAFALADRLAQFSNDSKIREEMGANSLAMAEFYSVSYGLEKISNIINRKPNIPWFKEEEMIKQKYKSFVSMRSPIIDSKYDLGN